MGLDVEGCIIYGAKIIKKKSKIVKTKYDENTGKPYLCDDNLDIWIFEETGNNCLENIKHSDNFFYNEEESFGIIGICISKTNLRGREKEHVDLIDLSKIEIHKNFLLNEKCHLYNFLSYGC